MTSTIGYEHPDPFDSGYIAAGSLHKLYYEQYGNKNGKPAIFLHGGPGGNTSRDSTKFFNPDAYRVVLFDQRGAGKSRPKAELKDNTTQHLIEDVELIRHQLDIQKWAVVFGGSWGSTLALAYAQAHPESVGSLILRGVLTGTRQELDAIEQSRSSEEFFPDAQEEWLQFLPKQDRARPIAAYYRILTSEDIPETELIATGRAWNRRELQMGQVSTSGKALKKLEDSDWVISHARLEAHYFKNDLFLEPDQLMKEESLERIRNIRSKRASAEMRLQRGSKT